MNAVPEHEWVNPWKSRDEFSAVDKRAILFSILALFLSALVIPLCHYEPLCFAVLAYLFFYVVVMARSPLPVSILLVTVFAAVSLSSIFTYRFAVGALLLAMVVGVGATAFLLTVLKRGWITLLLPFAACIVAYLFTESAPLSLLSFAFLPAGILLALATRLGKGRTTAICFAEAGLLLALLAGLGFLLLRESREAGLELTQYISSMRESIFEAAVEFRTAMQSFLEENPEMNDEMAGQLMSILTDEFFRESIRLVFNLLPAILCVLCSIIAFEGQLLLNASYRSVGWVRVLTPEARIFTMSLPAAVIYFVSFVITLFSKSDSLAMAVIQNLNLLLMPGFCVVGTNLLLLSLARAKGGARLLFLVLAAALLCCNVGGGLYLLALFGANSVVLGVLTQRLRERAERNDRGDGEDS